jgi:hypothetical protein
VRQQQNTTTAAEISDAPLMSMNGYGPTAPCSVYYSILPAGGNSNSMEVVHNGGP